MLTKQHAPKKKKKKTPMGQQGNLQYLETNDNANRTIQNLWDTIISSS